MWLLVALLAGPGWTPTEVTNTIKKAERAGYEQHDINALLALMPADARWIIGRTAVADAYDVTLNQKTVRAVMSIAYTGPPGTRRLEFLKTTIDLDATPPTLELIMSRRSHGGRALIRAAFELQHDAKGWRVVARREWPLEERIGPLPTLLDAGYWLDADAVVDQPGTDTLSERLSALMEARRYAQLMREASALAAQKVDDPQLWSYWAQAAFRAGALDEARRLAKIAKSKGGTPRLPAQLTR